MRWHADHVVEAASIDSGRLADLNERIGESCASKFAAFRDDNLTFALLEALPDDAQATIADLAQLREEPNPTNYPGRLSWEVRAAWMRWLMEGGQPFLGQDLGFQVKTAERWGDSYPLWLPLSERYAEICLLREGDLNRVLAGGSSAGNPTFRAFREFLETSCQSERAVLLWTEGRLGSEDGIVRIPFQSWDWFEARVVPMLRGHLSKTGAFDKLSALNSDNFAPSISELERFAFAHPLRLRNELKRFRPTRQNDAAACFLWYVADDLSNFGGDRARRGLVAFGDLMEATMEYEPQGDVADRWDATCDGLEKAYTRAKLAAQRA